MNHDDKKYLQLAIEFAKTNNPLWPFACLILNEEGTILCKAVDCAHISPLFHAESLAIHALIMNKGHTQQLGKLSLYSTAEPDVLSQSALHWAKVAHDLEIERVFFGSPLSTIESIWPFGINISAREIIERSSSNKPIHLVGPVCEVETNQLFREAKSHQEKLGKNHPARDILSNKITDFYELNL